jgi:hypothetical protein
MRTYVRLQNWHFANRAVLDGHGRDLWDRNNKDLGIPVLKTPTWQT